MISDEFYLLIVKLNVEIDEIVKFCFFGIMVDEIFYVRILVFLVDGDFIVFFY